MKKILTLLTFALAGLAVPSLAAEEQLVGPIDDSQRVVLHGNTRPETRTATDLGAVPDNTPMRHLLLQLRRSPAREAALKHAIDALYDPASPLYHHWLSPGEFGQRFGLSASDRSAILHWLGSHGFTVNVVYENGVLIDFSGTAGEVREAFHAPIHALRVAGVRHFANMGDPTIPAALAPAVEGIVALHDFKPHPMMKKRPQYTFSCSVGVCHGIVPADLATIYNFNPAFAAGYTGKGQTVVVIEDTNVHSTTDWRTFRKTFGLLTAYRYGSFVQVHPAPASGRTNCTNPGVNGDDGEAILDAEWASAAAPNAKIELASCNDTPDGLLIAIQNIVSEKKHPSIVSISYGECEAANGAASNAAYNAAYQQAASEGISVFVSAGDENAASCDANQANATHGIGVSGLASTVYNVAVGGTDFADGYYGDSSTYWSSTNSPTYGSALSYIPEIPWNGSCASQLIATYLGYSQTYGSGGFCNSADASNYGLIEVVGGSGGPSGCATGAPATPGVVGGTCAGYAKPSWQSVLGNPSDTVRDMPDVSLFASNGIWDEYYVYCYSDRANGGTPCTGAPSNWSGAGGTSFSSPIMAGIQALVNQKMGAAQGNPDPVYYQLAGSEYGSTGSMACTASAGQAPASSCIFYDVILGDMDANCTGANDCYLPDGTEGVLSTSGSAFDAAYGTTTGWDFATGIGTVNVYNLVENW